MGTGRLGRINTSGPKSRLRMYDNTRGIFLTQVRGGLRDCAMPSLTIEPKKHKISVDWKDLFTQFFGEKNMAKETLSQPSAKELMGLHPPFSIDPISESHLAGVTPSLQALARSDMEILQRNIMEEQVDRNRYHRLLRPAQWWSLAVGSTNTGGTSRNLVDHCRIRRKADQLVNLDEDGDVIETNVNSARDSAQSAATARNHEVQRKAKTCDQCRELNIVCARQNGAISCNSCVASNLQCHEELATLHRNISSARPRAYHIQLMLMRQVAMERLNDQTLSI